MTVAKKLKEKKITEFQKIQTNKQKYKRTLIISSKNIKSIHIQQLRDAFREDSKIMFSKKKIILSALSNKQLKDEFDNNNIFLLFSDREIENLLDTLKNINICSYLKVNDVYEEDLVLMKGDISCDDSISTHKELTKLGVPAILEDNKVVLKDNFLVSKKSEKVTEDQLKIMKICNIKLSKFDLLVHGYIENDEFNKIS